MGMSLSGLLVEKTKTNPFVHVCSANDLSNAIGPFSVIYYTWKNGIPAGAESDVEVWMLVYGAATLVLGLATYGYNIMSVLGNRITLVSPSRGFCMELGGAITVILVSRAVILRLTPQLTLLRL
jgi:sodium-dependent phosphate transporter